MNNGYSQVVKSQSNPVELQKLYNSFLGERMKMDKFFTMYLDKFEKKMDPDNTKTPIWDLYKKKLKEYSEIQQAIKAANYFIGKQAHV